MNRHRRAARSTSRSNLDYLEPRTLFSASYLPPTVTHRSSTDLGALEARPGKLSLAANHPVLGAAISASSLGISSPLVSPARAANPIDTNLPVVYLSQISLQPPPPPAIYDWHTQMINGVLNVWAPNPSDMGTTFTVTSPSSLFGPTGVPSITDLKQGQLADCYLLAVGGTLAFTHPSLLEQDIKNDPAGGWEVSFISYNPVTNQPTTMVIHTNDQLSESQAQLSASGDVWPLVLEKAYAAFRTWNGTNSTDTLASIGWGYPSTALAQMGELNQQITYSSASPAAFYNLLQSALAADKPVLFQTSATAPTMVSSHVYIITGVSTDASGTTWVTTYNPWGFYDTRTETDLLQNGIGTVVVGNA